MRRFIPLLLSVLLAPAVTALPVVVPAQAGTLAPVSPWLAARLADGAGGTLPVFVHGTDVTAARRAAAEAGLTLVTTWNRIGVAVGGTTTQIASVRTRSGVTYVEGDEPIRPLLSTSNRATWGEQTRTDLRDALGRPVDGRGVSAAVIDTGVDGNHPFFRNADGSSAVRRNLKNICGPLASSPDATPPSATARDRTVQRRVRR